MVRIVSQIRGQTTTFSSTRRRRPERIDSCMTREWETTFSNGATIPSSLTAAFEELAEQWDEESRFLSSTTEMVRCESYQRIVGLGPNAVPLIVARLRSDGDDPGHWHLALSEITGANPVASEHDGHVKRISEAWLGWAEETGHE